MSITSIVSKQAEKIKNLTQTISKMEKRIRELEKNYDRSGAENTKKEINTN